MTQAQSLIIDTDPGQDDAVAILLALASPEINLLGITAVAGNVPLALKQVVNTNRCMVHLHIHEGQLLVTSIIDNLLKGASGQAVENMNLMFGLEQTTGLHLKSTSF